MKGKDSLMKMLLAAGPASITISSGPSTQNPNFPASGSTSTSSSSTLTSPLSDQVEEYAAYRSSSYLKQLTSHNVSLVFDCLCSLECPALFGIIMSDAVLFQGPRGYSSRDGPSICTSMELATRQCQSQTCPIIVCLPVSKKNPKVGFSSFNEMCISFMALKVMIEFFFQCPRDRC